LYGASALHVTAMERSEQTSRQRPYQDEGAEGDGIPRIAKIERPDARHEPNLFEAIADANAVGLVPTRENLLSLCIGASPGPF
jgi:hypothetical protein